jgi:hypothetical protein
MTKQQKIMLGILGVGAIAYYLWYKNKNKKSIVEVTKDTKLTSTPTISESDKMTLFAQAQSGRGRGGDHSPEAEKKYEIQRQIGEKKIKELGLQKEYEDYIMKYIAVQ